MPNDVADAARAAARPAHPVSRAAIVVAVVALDQLTKAWAVDRLVDGAGLDHRHDVELHLSRNTGGAFSLFQGFTPLLAVLAVVIAVVLVRAVRRTEDRHHAGRAVARPRRARSATSSIAWSASPGFLHGAVVDFVRVGNFPTFNVADSRDHDRRDPARAPHAVPGLVGEAGGPRRGPDRAPTREHRASPGCG